MSDPIEKVAQAIFAFDEHWCRLGADVWETAPAAQKEKCRRMAMAAVKALREPTEAAKYKGDIAFQKAYGPSRGIDHGESIGPVGTENIADVWRAMIDALLEDQPTPTRTSRYRLR